jgi:hypothetical protein
MGGPDDLTDTVASAPPPKPDTLPEPTEKLG